MSDESSNVIVSVIIPVHNAAEYIAETLTTVLAQSLKEIEIILVNDSSTDNTLDIVTKIASEDSRVRVITNPSNVGGGESRNIGLRVATGEYIIFLDDDDYADKEMLKRMSDRATALMLLSAGASQSICKPIPVLSCLCRRVRIYCLKKRSSLHGKLLTIFSEPLYGGHGISSSDAKLSWQWAWSFNR